ncbi:20897_t:CDS:1, partial [Gigaspora rosea]
MNVCEILDNDQDNEINSYKAQDNNYDNKMNYETPNNGQDNEMNEELNGNASKTFDPDNAIEQHVLQVSKIHEVSFRASSIMPN